MLVVCAACTGGMVVVGGTQPDDGDLVLKSAIVLCLVTCHGHVINLLCVFHSVAVMNEAVRL